MQSQFDWISQSHEPWTVYHVNHEAWICAQGSLFFCYSFLTQSLSQIIQTPFAIEVERNNIFFFFFSSQFFCLFIWVQNEWIFSYRNLLSERNSIFRFIHNNTAIMWVIVLLSTNKNNDFFLEKMWRQIGRFQLFYFIHISNEKKFLFQLFLLFLLESAEIFHISSEETF